MELWKALLLFDEQNPQPEKPPTPANVPVYKPPKTFEPKKGDFSFFEEYNEPPKTETVTPRDANGKVPLRLVDPKNADQPLNGFRYNDFVKLDRGYLAEFPDLEGRVNSTSNPATYGPTSSTRSGSVAMPVSEYNDAVKAPWEGKGRALDLDPLKGQRTYSEPVPYMYLRDYKQYRGRGSDSDGNRSVPIISREGSLAHSDISLPYSEPYPGTKAHRRRHVRTRKRQYVYIPPREEAIREASERSEPDTPEERPKRVYNKPPRDYRRDRKHKSRPLVNKTRRGRSRPTDSDVSIDSDQTPDRNDRRKRSGKRELSGRRHESRQRSSSHSGNRDNRAPRDIRLKDSSKRRGKTFTKKAQKPIDPTRYVALSSRESRRSTKGSRNGQRNNGTSAKPSKHEKGSSYVNKVRSVYNSEHNKRRERIPSRSSDGTTDEEEDDTTGDSGSVDSSSEEDSYSSSESEPSQQVSEGDDDPTTTEGDVTLRKGGKGMRRYEDADGASSVNTDIKELQGSHQGKRAYFYNFKEQGSPAVIESVSSKRFPNFETLLNELTIKFQIDKGANFVYHWPSTTQIRYISDFKSHGTYIVASTAMRKGQLEAVYGKLGPKHWHIGKVKHNDSPLVRNPPPEERSPAVGQHYSDNKKPLVVWLVCNSTQKRTKVFLKPSRYFEDLMAGEITDAVNLELPPACALYAFNNDRVGKEIGSLSQLVRQYRKDYTVLVCGREKVPADWAYRGSPPYSSDSYRPPLRPRPKYVIGADSAPPRVDMIQMNGNSSPRTSGVQNGIPALNRYDTVKVKINGRRRGMEKAQQNEFYASYQDMEDELGKPDRKLILDWVYGYRGSDRHRNLDILDTSELVYYVAAVVVIFDWHNHTQRFYTGHNEDITCLTIHPQQNRVATGQLQGRGSDHGAHIRIWDVDSLSTIALIGLGVFQNGITSISFSDYTLQHIDNDLMMVIDDSFRHTMTIWDVQTERMLTKTTVLAAKTNTETVTGGCFYPSEDDILITYGRQHLYFWRLDWEHDRTPYARILRDKLSGFSEPQDKTKDDIPTHFTALAFSSTGEVITGDSNGSIMIWSRDNDNVFSLSRSDSEINIHQSAITYLAVLADGMLLSGGGSEMFLWDTMNRYKNPQRIQVNISGNIQAIAPNHAHFEDGVIFLGTDKNCILQGHLHQKFSTIVQGHSGDSVSIAVHPKEYTTHVKAREYCFVTAGKDLVIKWSASQRIPIWKTKIEGEKCTAVAVDHHDRMVALGTKSGKVIILNDTNRGREENTIVIGAKKINTVAFSPNGMRLAVAVDDGYLHICSVDKGALGRVHATSNVHGLSMTNIDWSRDCRFLQTSSTDFQVFFWNADKKPKLIPGHKLRDADWTTHKALVSHSILGPWQHLDAGETIKAVDRSNGPQKDLLVTGDSMGRLRLYKYPCSSSESEYRGTKAYSGAINSVMFSGDDYFVFSSASSVVNNDLKNHLGIMQWAIVEADAQVHPKYYQPNYYPHHHPHHYYPQHPHYPNPHYYNQHNPYFKRYQ
ncbi:echinoderm microtubule-associated protein-like CG42247 isoform X1 [Haliotis cracherodii]|uniref:echinoderm microtubule-associated protein-like CG42247 isoform X1 n=1 Tax=Haliotis cracherodii TaxID=6455 RepID=UPI0039E793BB